MNAGKRKVGINAGAVLCASAFFLLCQPHPVLAQAPFYQGKTITVIAGQEPGGLGDLRLKSILPYFKKHIPGQPNIVTEYMPGGGGRKAANYIYRTARPDGLTLGYPPGGFVRRQPSMNQEWITSSTNLASTVLPNPRTTMCFSPDGSPISAHWIVSAPAREYELARNRWAT